MNLKHLLKVLPLLLFSAFSMANIQQVAPKILLNLIQNNHAPIILDVRSLGEYQQGHVQGAINISYDQLDKKSVLLAEYKQQPIVLYCRSGSRAQVARGILEKKGFTQLVNLQGNMLLWNQYQYPLVR